LESIRLPRMMQDTALAACARGKKIALVPTMGALHEGHLSLVRAAKAENDIVVVSIFVNPAQFGPGEDFERYPRDLAGDKEKLEKEQVDMLFLPEAQAIYPEGFKSWLSVEGLSEKLCGAHRPGHFRGVATVVLKLLNIVAPARAYFGQKDYQQSLVISTLARDLNLPVEIVVRPTVREEDGLAISSRNIYLSNDERKAAPVLYRALSAGAEAIKNGSSKIEDVKKTIHQVLRAEPLVTEIQYASVYDPNTLDELAAIKSPPVLLAGAIKLSNIRLIDNLVLNDLK
jgi:pantoate--beta-alanine ligase